jgi:hypothetical protein
LNYQQQQQQPPDPKKTRVLQRGLPDQTVHQPVSAMAVLGWIGLIAAIVGNLWQIYTTIAGVYRMFTNHTAPPLDFRNVTVDICILIAFSFQLALLYLVFRIDTRWKRQQTGTTNTTRRQRQQQQVASTGYARAAIEVVQQLGLFGIWVGLAFVIDTLGDYTFIAEKTTNTDPVTGMFLIFLYAVALYALSTLVFVRAWEYLWAASAVKEHWDAMRERRQMNPRSNTRVPKY